MAKSASKTTTLAPTGNGAVTKTNGNTQQLPLAEGWYSGVIVDMDDAYQTKATGKLATIFQIQVTNSRRYKGRSVSFMVTEEMENPNRQDGSSKRADLIERFGVDVFDDPDFYLDLAVRFHIMPVEETLNGVGTGEFKLRCVSIYPQVVKESGEGE